MGICFSCNKKLGIINNWRDSKAIQKRGFETPKQMSKQDKLCEACLQTLVREQVRKRPIPPVKLILENASTAAMISGVLILIVSVFALFLVGQYGWHFLLIIPELVLLGWGLYKLGSRQVISNPLELITKIQVLTEKVTVLKNSIAENKQDISKDNPYVNRKDAENSKPESQMTIQELEEKINESPEKKNNLTPSAKFIHDDEK